MQNGQKKSPCKKRKAEDHIGLDEEKRCSKKMKLDEEEIDEDYLICTHDNKYSFKIPLKAKEFIGIVNNILEGDEDSRKLTLPKKPYFNQFTLKSIDSFIKYHYKHDPEISIREPHLLGNMLYVFPHTFDCDFARSLTLKQLNNLIRVDQFLNVKGLQKFLEGTLVTKIFPHTEKEILNALLSYQWPKEKENSLDPQYSEIVILSIEKKVEKNAIPNNNGEFANAVNTMKKNPGKYKAFEELSSEFWDHLLKKYPFNEKMVVSLRDCELCDYIMTKSNNVHLEIIKCETLSISEEVLMNVVRYLKHHRGSSPPEIAKPVRSVQLANCVDDPWDVSFITSLHKPQLFQLILAANKLEVRSLLHLGCALIGTWIKGKSPQEIKEILG